MSGLLAILSTAGQTLKRECKRVSFWDTLLELLVN